MRWVRSIPRRLLAPADKRAVPAFAPDRRLTSRPATPQTNGRTGPTRVDAQEARAAVAALLVDIERLQPGLAPHRSLDLQGGSGVRAQALCESFGKCDAFCATPDAVRTAESENRYLGRCRYLHGTGRQELSFPDETFDFVHCGTLSSDEQDGERIVAEALRVLRLNGVAVMDLARKRRAPEGPLGAVGLLFRLPGFGAGRGTHQVDVTVTNGGARVLGSALAPLRLKARWRRSGGALGVAGEAALDGVLLPGDSRSTTLPVTATGISGIHLLELSLVDESPWGERRLAVTTFAVAVGTRDRGGATASAPLDADRRLCAAVARAEGVVLGVRARESATDLEPWTRYFFARA